jgi:type II secretory pathway component GspD/PulD (secretin)
MISSLFISVCLMFFLLVPTGLGAGQKQSMSVDDRSAQNSLVQLAQRESAPPLVLPPPLPPMPRQTPADRTPGSLNPPTALPPGTSDPQVLFPSQPPPTEPAPSQSPPAAMAIQELTTGGVNMGQVSLNFDDADVYSVIQTIFANILRYNYVIDPRVKGRVTFRSIAPVAREDILPLMEVILRLNGIAIVEESGLYRIIPMSDAPREPAPVGYGRDPQSVKLSGKALLQVVPIRYLQSTEMVKLITPFLSTNAVVVDVPKSNYIIMVDTDSNVKRLLKLIDLFDNEQQKEKRPQVFLYNVQNSKAKDMAALLQQIFLGAKAPADQGPAKTTSGSTSQTTQTSAPSPAITMTTPQMVGEAIVSASTKIIPDEVLNVVVIVATAEDYATIKQAIDKIDVMPRQVLFEGIVAQVTLTDNLSLGLAWSLKMNMGILGTTIAFNPPAIVDSKTASSSPGFTFWGIDPGGGVRAMINALAKDQRSKVLAAPHIMVADNREAKIQIGQQVPIVTSETYGSATIAPQRTIQYKDIGIILKVKPRIHEGGLVSVELYQEVSSYDTIKLGFEETTIILNKMDATTTLVVKDNQTIVIGGLIREDTSKSNDGIPFLNKIPILGYLFGNTEDNKKRQEIIILLTPHVVKSNQDAEDVTGEYVNKMSTLEGGKMKPFEPIKKLQKGDEKPEDKKNGESGTPVINVPIQ